MMLDAKINCRDILINQINSANIKKEYTNFYISITFEVNHKQPKLPVVERGVPLEMRIFKANKPPTQFLLHVVDGYICELEIINADSSKLELNTEADHVELVTSSAINSHH